MGAILTLLFAGLMVGFMLGLIVTVPILNRKTDKIWKYYMALGTEERKGDSY